MRVLQINSVCGTGSTGRIAADLYKMLEENGHECCIAYGRGTAPRGLNTIKIGTKLDVYYHGIMSRITDKHGFYSKHATKVFIEKVKKYNPDIIHLHNIHGYYMNIPLLFQYLKESGKPVIWTLHDCWAFTGHCSYFDFAGCERWKNMCYQCPQKKAYPKSLVMDRSKDNYLTKKKLFTSLNQLILITPSIWLKGIVSQSFFKPFPINTISNGIDLSVFQPTPSDFRKKNNLKNKILILGVANIWDKRKGYDVFVNLAQKLPDKYRLIMVGLSKKQIRKLPSNILGITRTADLNELAALYTTANLFFNASVEETMGMVTVEALACGIPVLAFNATAVPEAITPSCGVILNSYETDDIVNAIMQNEWSEFHADSCRRQASKYQKESRLKDYLLLYERYR